MARDRFGRFARLGLDVTYQGDIAYVYIRHREQLVKVIFDREDISKFRNLGSLCIRKGYVCLQYYPNCVPDGRKSRFIQVSRIVMDCPEGMTVDHTYGDKLDNRKTKLRIVPHVENCQNRPILNRNNRSGARGVLRERYGASVVVDDKRIHLGTFDTLEEAAEAVEKTTGRKVRPANKNSKTGIRGVYLIKPKAMIRVYGKRHYLGSFDTVGEAREAVKEKLNTPKALI